MSDFYSVIAREVTGLRDNTIEARQALYERVRTALSTWFISATPRLSEADIVNQRRLLEEAIQKVEAESARAAAELLSGTGSPEFDHPFLWISIAIRALNANRLRSALTSLAVVLGVATVISMVAVGAGARSKINEKISKLGTNLLFVQPHKSAGAHNVLTEDDAAMLRQLPNVQISAPIIWGGVQVIAGSRNLKTTVFGNNSDYLIARDWPLTAGRLFSKEEIASASKVAILGQGVAEKLFDGELHIGGTIRINSVPFIVVGVLQKKGDNGAGSSLDDMIVIPMRTARSRVLGSQYDKPQDDKLLEEGTKKEKVQIDYPHQLRFDAIDYLVIKYAQSASEEVMKKAVKEALQRGRDLRQGKDFDVYSPADVLATKKATTNSFSLMLAAVASISVVVGGISIMNTMLVSVTERTREIGLRMAVGARRRDIRNQFLVEAALLALLGALAGTVFGVVTAAVIAHYGGWPVLINPAVVLLACASTGVVGIVFGLMPAIRASRLDPIVALRTE